MPWKGPGARGSLYGTWKLWFPRWEQELMVPLMGEGACGHLRRVGACSSLDVRRILWFPELELELVVPWMGEVPYGLLDGRRNL